MLTVYYTMSLDCLSQIWTIPFSVRNPQDSFLLQRKAENVH